MVCAHRPSPDSNASLVGLVKLFEHFNIVLEVFLRFAINIHLSRLIFPNSPSRLRIMARLRPAPSNGEFRRKQFPQPRHSISAILVIWKAFYVKMTFWRTFECHRSGVRLRRNPPPLRRRPVFFTSRCNNFLILSRFFLIFENFPKIVENKNRDSQNLKIRWFTGRVFWVFEVQQFWPLAKTQKKTLAVCTHTSLDNVPVQSGSYRGFWRKRPPDRWHSKVLQNIEKTQKTFKIIKIMLIECHSSGVRLRRNPPSARTCKVRGMVARLVRMKDDGVSRRRA